VLLVSTIGLTTKPDGGWHRYFKVERDTYVGTRSVEWRDTRQGRHQFINRRECGPARIAKLNLLSTMRNIPVGLDEVMRIVNSGGHGRCRPNFS